MAAGSALTSDGTATLPPARPAATNHRHGCRGRRAAPGVGDGFPARTLCSTVGVAVAAADVGARAARSWTRSPRTARLASWGEAGEAQGRSRPLVLGMGVGVGSGVGPAGTSTVDWIRGVGVTPPVMDQVHRNADSQLLHAFAGAYVSGVTSPAARSGADRGHEGGHAGRREAIGAQATPRASDASR